MNVDLVNDPPHYKTKSGLEATQVVEAFELEFHEGVAVQYILRAKNKEDRLMDLRKARWYLDRKIKMLEAEGVE